jgi:hypothetical protein
VVPSTETVYYTVRKIIKKIRIRGLIFPRTGQQLLDILK